MGSVWASEKYAYKLDWAVLFAALSRGQGEAGRALCDGGDFNIALEDRDIHDPGRLGGGIMASGTPSAGPARGIKRSAARCLPSLRAQRRALELVGLPQRRWDRDRAGGSITSPHRRVVIALRHRCAIDKVVRSNTQPAHAPGCVNRSGQRRHADDDKSSRFSLDQTAASLGRRL